MSLSQKHAGKVLVPWFNKAEWNAVYNLIYKKTAQNLPKALEILKIWKLRTPLLSAGVEGTLIILEALLVNRNQLSSYESSHIFSTSLVRFLNLCAANSDKQGTFYKTAIKNELPKWLINLRHDIAHSHKVPSLSMLELSLKFCLEWLKEKYWDVQHKNMVDFVVNQLNSVVIEDGIFLIAHVKEVESGHQNRRLMKRLDRLIKNEQKQMSSTEIFETVNNMLGKQIRKNKEESIEKIATLLLEKRMLLSTKLEIEEKSGIKKIPLETKNKWNPLLDMIHEEEILPTFVLKLFNFICNDKYDPVDREVASLWLKEIFVGLINRENNCQDENCLFFKSNNECMKIKSFTKEVVDRINPFTLSFVKEVLQYNNAPPQFIEDSITLISIFNSRNRINFPENKIFTVDDLNLNMENLSVDHLDDKIPQKKSRWTIIEDTTDFINLPLGILPHQDRNRNPLLQI